MFGVVLVERAAAAVLELFGAPVEAGFVNKGLCGVVLGLLRAGGLVRRPGAPADEPVGGLLSFSLATGLEEFEAPGFEGELSLGGISC